MIGELVRRLRLMGQASEIIAQQNLIIIREAHANQAWQTLALETTRRFRDLAEAALVAQDEPEIDLRENLYELMRELEDQIARLEEHVCHD